MSSSMDEDSEYSQLLFQEGMPRTHFAIIQVFSEDAVLEDFTPQMRRWIVEYVNLDNLKKIGYVSWMDVR